MNKFFASLSASVACALLLCSSCGDPKSPQTPNIVKPGGGGSTTVKDPEVGDNLNAWTAGDLEIHFISTGRGESTLYIFPDGTSMLIDCGGSLATKAICDARGIEGPTEWKPSDTTPCEKVIADYIKKVNPNKDKVDYFLLSHFDEDHMGKYPPAYPETANMPMHEAGFYMNGIGELSTYIKFNKIIDRGYKLPVDRSNETRFKDYIKVLNWNKTANGTQYEVAKPGSNTQIAMVHDPSKYKNFSVRILCGSGYVWTGQGEETRRTAPDYDAIVARNPAENVWSVGLAINFGAFNMFTAGDLQYNDRTKYPWMDVESPLIPVLNPVEVMKADHHGTSNTNCPELLNKLKPANVVFTPWRDVQPNAATVKNMKTSNSMVNFFSTGTVASKRTELSGYADSFRAWDGHIAIRIKPDGKYTFYVLEDRDMNRKINAIYGPYKSN